MQFDVSVNIWAVLVSAVASIVIGSIWYGPLFGKMFMELMGFNKLSPQEQEAMKKEMFKPYVIQTLSSVLMFFVLGWLIGALNMPGYMGGIQAAFWVWLGFVMPVQLGQQIWGGKMKLFWLGAGNMLLTLIAAGAIIGAWR